MAPVRAVQVDHYRVPRLMNDCGGIVRLLVETVDQAALQTVVQPRPDGVVTGVPQHEALVLGVFPIREQLRVEIFFAIFGLGAELEGFLRHVQTVLPLQLKLHVLIQQLVVLLVVILHVAGLCAQLLGKLHQLRAVKTITSHRVSPLPAAVCSKFPPSRGGYRLAASTTHPDADHG